MNLKIRQRKRSASQPGEREGQGKAEAGGTARRQPASSTPAIGAPRRREGGQVGTRVCRHSGADLRSPELTSDITTRVRELHRCP